MGPHPEHRAAENVVVSPTQANFTRSAGQRELTPTLPGVGRGRGEREREGEGEGGGGGEGEKERGEEGARENRKTIE